MISWQLVIVALALTLVAGAILGDSHGYWCAIRDLTTRDEVVPPARETLPRAWLASYRWHHAGGWVRRDSPSPPETAMPDVADEEILKRGRAKRERARIAADQARSSRRPR